MPSTPVTLRDLFPSTEGEHPLADKFAICLSEGHDWEWSHDIWLVCERCGCKTPGNMPDE